MMENSTYNPHGTQFVLSPANRTQQLFLPGQMTDDGDEDYMNLDLKLQDLTPAVIKHGPPAGVRNQVLPQRHNHNNYFFSQEPPPIEQLEQIANDEEGYGEEDYGDYGEEIKVDEVQILNNGIQNEDLDERADWGDHLNQPSNMLRQNHQQPAFNFNQTERQHEEAEEIEGNSKANEEDESDQILEVKKGLKHN